MTRALLCLVLAGGVGLHPSTALIHAGAGDVLRAAAPPTPIYRVVVGSESADFLHIVRFGPDGGVLERSLSVADLYEQSHVPERFTESEAPHGVAVEPGGGAVLMTTGHGLPDGKLWRVEPESGRLLAGPVDLGRFPASVGVSPDGRFAGVANFNLHGEMVPSSISILFLPDLVELARIETCTMPHGSRFLPGGGLHHSVCMMDDQLVEIDLAQMGVSRRMHLSSGAERTLSPDDRGPHDPDGPHAGHEMHYEAVCSPTWVQPEPTGARLYVACNRGDYVLEVDVESWAPLRRFRTGRGPYNLDITPDGRLLVVTLKQGHGVEFIDLDRGETAGRTETSTRVVHGVALSPDSRFAFVSVEGIGDEPGKVDVFDLATYERVASVAVGQQASGIAFWRMEAGDG